MVHLIYKPTHLQYFDIDFYIKFRNVLISWQPIDNILLFVDENEITTFPMTGYRFDKYYRKTLIELFGEQK